MISKFRKRCKQFAAILNSIQQHPLAGKHRFKAYQKLFCWQIKNLIDAGQKKVRFTDKCFLLVKKGMTGATGNIYTGLHEFNDMGFLLHFLRRGDIFFDIGANVGSYTVLASAHVGATTYSFEPVPSTFEALKKNLLVNDIGAIVHPLNKGVGSKNEKLRFTANHDTVNHVVSSETISPSNIDVDVILIDEIAVGEQVPSLIKIDVEGFETEVIKGMSVTLANPILKAIIIELNGSGGRYGFDENLIHTSLLDAGFKSFLYDPFTRKLSHLARHGNLNTIYLRDISFISNRIATADKVKIFSEEF